MNLTIIEEAILNLWNTTDRSTTIVWDREKNYNFIALYILEGNQVIIELESVLLSYEQAALPDLDLYTYSQLVFLHELGHSEDHLLNAHYLERCAIGNELTSRPHTRRAIHQMEYEMVKLLLLSEYRAWKKARKNLPDSISKEDFYRVMRSCMANYLLTFDAVIQNYRTGSIAP